MRTLNLGILAHVDAGKTTLTERLLYAAGVIDELGSVDDGTTQTDTLALEQQRGITIKAAVASFTVGDVDVNLIDTPGHPEFIAEVERALMILDGAVLVISAVEGVQPQTRILFRALERLRVPTVMFVNKMDRPGANKDHVLASMASRLTDPVAHPTFFGSALTGAGVASLTEGLVELLGPAEADVGGPVAGRVFKIERGRRGEKIAYVRLFSGTLHLRDRVSVANDAIAKVIGIETFAGARSGRASSLSAGQLGRVWGLAAARVGDVVGEMSDRGEPVPFPPPTMEAVVVPSRAADRGRLRVALGQLAEQDPLINVHVDDHEGELVVSLYGEVQKEVLHATLAQDFGVEVRFRETTTVYIERPRRVGNAVEYLWSENHPYSATVGLRLEPAPAGSGIDFRLDTDPRTVPLHIYRTRDQFIDHMRRYVSVALGRGRFGWQVTDCLVTMTDCGYYASDGRRKPVSPTPRTNANDFRKLTSLVVRQALERAGTVVCEPMVRVSIETPAESLGALIAFASRLGAAVDAPSSWGDLATVEAVMPPPALHELSRELPGLTGGEGALETSFAGYRPIKAGSQPHRDRRG